MAALLALSAAAAYGVGDFLGGVASRREPSTAVVMCSHVIGLVLMLAAAPLMAGEVSVDAITGGAVAGLIGAAAVTTFYQALSLGYMSVVAPVTGLLSAGVPVLVGLVQGDRPAPAALIGIAVALVAIALVSRQQPGTDGAVGPDPALRGRVLKLSLAAGLGFGLFFVALDGAAEGAGLWPLVGARSASVTMFVALGALGAIAVGPPRRALSAAVGAGVLEALANAFYLVALSHGMLSVVAVLTALYPASTLILARWALGERVSSVQQVGLGFAAAAALLIAL